METIRFDSPQPQIVYGILGDTFIYANEREVVEEVYSQMEGEGEPQTFTRFEYDVRHFPLKDKTEAGALAALKAQIIAELEKYDSSDEVNGFTLNGQHLWLDKATRNGLDYRFKCEKAMGQTDTTLWYGTTPITLNIDIAVTMLQAVEVYASACFDRTSNHKAAILALGDIEAVFNYDYTAGYPEKLAF